MIDAFSLWNSIILIYNENFLQVALIVNVILTLFLISQNVHNRKLLRIYTSPSEIETIKPNVDIPPFIDKTLTNSSGKQTAGSDLPKIDRAIKMIKDGCTQKEIVNVVDIEAAYIRILQQNYKANER
tara:strand:- start:229 stop:609 length:381 start_codon:yes stop_codon:yes gene_type:complete